MHFLDEFDTFNKWNKDNPTFEEPTVLGAEGNDHISFSNSPDYLRFPPARSSKAWSSTPPEKDDRVNSPSHYTSGKVEVIDVIEDAVKTAPSAIYGMLQGQVLKYMLRVWLKDNPLEDLKKAEWYLTRLIEHYSNPPGDR